MTSTKRLIPTTSGDEREYLGDDKQPMGPGGRKHIKASYSRKDRKATKLALRFGKEF